VRPPETKPFKLVSSALPLFLTIAIGAAGIALGGLMAWVWLSTRRKNAYPLPGIWAISSRPVFNTGERRLYRQLKDAFPQHVVIPKLPLVRLCQPNDREKVEYWYGLLGSTHATFTICSSNGKAVLAIDLESPRARSKRTLEIKEAVLNACQVKYFSIAANGMPTIAALQLLLPQAVPEGVPASPRDELPPERNIETGNRSAEAQATPVHPADRTMHWQDSSVFMDSFFAPDSRQDAGSQANAPRESSISEANSDQHDDIGGVVVDDGTPEPDLETTSPSAIGR
jgi:hypothetical protein